MNSLGEFRAEVSRSLSSETCSLSIRFPIRSLIESMNLSIKSISSSRSGTIFDAASVGVDALKSAT